MEFIRGRRWRAARDRHALQPAESIRIGIDLCRAVAAVHAAGLLHRDIKAQNVMRADDGRIVLMDFGTGRELATAAASDLAGTPLYLAPELFAGEPATVQSDVYSLGVLLYHLLTGTYPVTGKRCTTCAWRTSAANRARSPTPPGTATSVNPSDQARHRSTTGASLQKRDGTGRSARSAQRGARRRWIGYAGPAAAPAVMFMLWWAKPGQR